MSRFRSVGFVLVGITIGLCWHTTRGARPADDTLELYGTFVDAVEQVQANYVQPVPRKQLIEHALRGMLAELDPYSNYLNESDWKDFQKQVDGNFTGVGISIDRDRATGLPVVIAPMVGSPAYAAGILAGDLILQIDGQATEDWNRDKIVQALSGRAGTEVKLTVRHPGTDKPETLTMTRAVIELESVLGDHRKADDRWEFLLDPEHKIGYVRITSFVPETVGHLKKVLSELKEQGVKGLILDLRDDPGGRLEAAVDVANLFLGEGTIVTTKGRNFRDRVYAADKEGTYEADQLPMIVLINQHTASAAEIVSAALQDHKRAKVVGQRSFGKGSVQNVLPLDNGESRLKLTVATYWRPSEKNIHRFKDARESDEWGVAPDPDLAVKITPEQYRTWAASRQRRDLVSRANKPADPDSLSAPLKSDIPLAKALEGIKADLNAPK